METVISVIVGLVNPSFKSLFTMMGSALLHPSYMTGLEKTHYSIRCVKFYILNRNTKGCCNILNDIHIHEKSR